MDNKYKALFTNDMTDKQIWLRYFEVSDHLEKGSQDYNELLEATLEASREALERFQAKAKTIEQEYAKKGLGVICCS